VLARRQPQLSSRHIRADQSLSRHMRAVQASPRHMQAVQSLVTVTPTPVCVQAVVGQVLRPLTSFQPPPVSVWPRQLPPFQTCLAASAFAHDAPFHG
jgi:hypothetical protein